MRFICPVCGKRVDVRRALVHVDYEFYPEELDLIDDDDFEIDPNRIKKIYFHPECTDDYRKILESDPRKMLHEFGYEDNNL